MPTDYDQVRSVIRSELARRGWSERRLAKEAGLSPGTVSHFLRGHVKKGSSDTIGKIATALELQLDVLMGRELRLHEPAATEFSAQEAAAAFAKANRIPAWAVRDVLQDPELVGVSWTAEEWYVEMRQRSKKGQRHI